MRTTIRGSIFETNSSSEHAFMYLSKEMFEKWRRGEVKIKGDGYPVTDLTDSDFEIAKKKPDTVYGPQTDEYPKEEWIHKELDAIDNPEVKADLLYVMRNYITGKEYKDIEYEKWDGSYISMLLIYLRHGGECVSREHANKKYVDPEEWGPPYEEVLAKFRKNLSEIVKWKDINDEKYVNFRKIINELRAKEELTDEDIMALWSIMFFEMDDYGIKDKKFRAFREAFYALEGHDVVHQNAFMDVRDNGKNVRIHIWGRDDG